MSPESERTWCIRVVFPHPTARMLLMLSSEDGWAPDANVEFIAITDEHIQVPGRVRSM